MHSTLFKAALIAVLGLGGTLLGTNGAPAAVAPFQHLGARGVKFGGAAKGGKGVGSGIEDIGGAAGAAGHGGASGSGWAQVGAKDIVDPRTLGYKYDGKYTSGEGWSMVKVFGPGKDTTQTAPLDLVGYDKKGGTMVVMQAWNAGDKTASRIPLRGILLSVWKTEAGSDVKDLKHIQYENVVEKDVVKAINDAYLVMGKTADMKTLTVGVAGTTLGEQAAFQKLAKGNPFGLGAQKMIDDYAEMAGRKITGFTVGKSGGSTRYIVNLS
jgi:hypothetical protein